MSIVTAIVLFDGACGLCSRTVDFIVPRDRRGVFRFAALQSATGRALLDRHGLACAGLDSVVLIAGGHVATKSEAVLRIARRLGGVWALLALPGLLVPRRLADALYDTVARNRLRWFPGPAACRTRASFPSDRFLDHPEAGARSDADAGSR